MITPHHLHVLQHALGLDEYAQTSYGRGGRYSGGETYRNRFVTDDEGGDGNLCNELVTAGLMVRHPPRDISGGDPIFVVTEAGKAYVCEHSPRSPKVSRGRARYLKWLHVSDAFPDWTFGDWLKSKHGRKDAPHAA